MDNELEQQKKTPQELIGEAGRFLSNIKNDSALKKLISLDESGALQNKINLAVNVGASLSKNAENFTKEELDVYEDSFQVVPLKEQQRGRLTTFGVFIKPLEMTITFADHEEYKLTQFNAQLIGGSVDLRYERFSTREGSPQTTLSMQTSDSNNMYLENLILKISDDDDNEKLMKEIAPLTRKNPNSRQVDDLMNEIEQKLK